MGILLIKTVKHHKIHSKITKEKSEHLLGGGGEGGGRGEKGALMLK